ncbi:MAG: hypothetical protein H0X03_02625 [Nitrosopumilus sp.]|nr:hypothetical protein [Nitrosopumilus sp.]
MLFVFIKEYGICDAGAGVDVCVEDDVEELWLLFNLIHRTICLVIFISWLGSVECLIIWLFFLSVYFH